ADALHRRVAFADRSQDPLAAAIAAFLDPAVEPAIDQGLDAPLFEILAVAGTDLGLAQDPALALAEEAFARGHGEGPPVGPHHGEVAVEAAQFHSVATGAQVAAGLR